jgi:hypothetical protein
MVNISINYAPPSVGHTWYENASFDRFSLTEAPRKLPVFPSRLLVSKMAEN